MEQTLKTSNLSQAEFELRCPIETKILSVLRTFVTSLAQQMGFNDEQTDQIELAVDEACANVIRHAYKHVGVSPDLPHADQSDSASAKSDCVLWIRIYLADDYLKISVIDHGSGQQPAGRAVNSVEEFHDRGGTGGLGTYIIRHFMDEVEYTYPEFGTILTMTKYLNSSSKFIT